MLVGFRGGCPYQGGCPEVDLEKQKTSVDFTVAWRRYMDLPWS